jgi:hypothetical protein
VKIDPSQHQETTNQSGGATLGLAVWARIVSELAELQDAASRESPGSVVNPICGKPYVVDTCCAAAVFAGEYQRTGDERWRTRAADAVAAARRGGLFRGVHEPNWDLFGWHDVAESLTATGIAVDAYCDSLNRLGLVPNDDQVEDLLALLLRCRTAGGGFAHNTQTPGQRTPEVQNATASALNLLGRLGRGKRTENHPVCAGRGATLSRLGRGQTASGFWPYHYPRSTLRKTLDMPLKVLLMPTRYPVYLGYGDVGDVAHHLMALYFATGYFSSSGTTAATTMLASGWGWIRKRLVHAEDHGLAIDWTVDPAPQSPRYSNSRDTNAYFLILGAIPGLTSLGIVDKTESGAVAEALLAHVGSALISNPGRMPCIVPCEGPVEVVRNVLPMFEQSVAWKGRLMVEVILAVDQHA